MLLDAQVKDSPEQRRKDSELLNKLSAAHYHFRNDRSAFLMLKLSLFLTPSHPETLRIMARVEYRLGRYRQALDTILDLESVTNEPLEYDWRLIKAMSLAKLGEVEAGRATMSRE